MPYGPEDAQKHNSKANTPRLQRMWSDVWNSTHTRTGDEGQAFAEANAAIDNADRRARHVDTVSRMRRRSGRGP